MDAAYGATVTRRVMALDPVEVPNAQRVNLNDLAQWAADCIVQGAC
jgi:CRISPR system Cascade subunit CasC